MVGGQLSPDVFFLPSVRTTLENVFFGKGWTECGAVTDQYLLMYKKSSVMGFTVILTEYFGTNVQYIGNHNRR